MLIFIAYGYTNVQTICEMIAQTCVFDVKAIKAMLYVTLQHTSGIRTRQDALNALGRYAPPSSSAPSNLESSSTSTSTTNYIEDLLV